MIQKLKKEVKSKNNILSYMTHHVRTPLNTIIASLDMHKPKKNTKEIDLIYPAKL